MAVKNSAAAVVLALAMATPAVGQSPPKQEIDIYSFIEELFAVQDEDISYDDLYESLFQLYADPLDLNRATFEDFASLYLLTPVQIEAIIGYRRLNGDFLSVYELQAVPGLDMSDIRRMLPFVTTENTNQSGKPLLQRILSERNNYLIVRTERTVQPVRGFSPPDTASDGSLSSKYAGGPFKHYARFRVSHPGDFSLGLTMEKDAGEKFSWQPGERQYGFDYYSFHVQVKNQGRFSAVNVGDYQLQMGQGLVFGAGFAPGKGGETLLTTKRNSIGLMPYSSVLETGFFRGAAATYSLGRFELTGLVSRLRQDGNIRTDSLPTGPEETISSVLSTGLHRTAAELTGRDRVAENAAGGALVYRYGGLQVGINVLHSQFSTAIRKRPALYSQFEFAGQSNTVGSIHFSKLWQNTQFFGEAARSASGGTGLIGGLMLSITNELGISLVGRSYDRHFHSFYARAFGENTRNINEKGLYWGVKWRPLAALTFTAYYDKFSFPWLRYNVDAPSDGHEYLAMATYSFSKGTRAYAQFRQQVKAVSSDIDENVSIAVPGQRETLAINLDHDTGQLLSFKSRVQLSRYIEQGPASHGIALVQDINATLGRWKLSSRFAVFDADYQNRLYVYEKDVLYAFSIPAYSGTGIRSYLMLQYKASRKVTVWARWARFTYPNQEAIGSGLQEISGSVRSDIKLQLKVSF